MFDVKLVVLKYAVEIFEFIIFDCTNSPFNKGKFVCHQYFIQKFTGKSTFKTGLQYSNNLNKVR